MVFPGPEARWPTRAATDAEVAGQVSRALDAGVTRILVPATTLEDAPPRLLRRDGGRGLGDDRPVPRDRSTGPEGRPAPAEWPDWVSVIEPEIRAELAFSRLLPDLAGCRRSTGVWPGPDEALVELVLDWVAEVVSPSTEGFERERKREAYGLVGVPR